MKHALKLISRKIQNSCIFTVWKFIIFLPLRFYMKLVCGILEVKKSAAFVVLEPADCHFYEFFTFLKAEIFEINLIQSP